jgi:hypothetical protein
VKAQTFVHACDRILDIVPAAADQVIDVVVVVVVVIGRADILTQRFCRTWMSSFPDESSSSETSGGGVLNNVLVAGLNDLRFLGTSLSLLDSLSVLGADGDLGGRSPESRVMLGWFSHLFLQFY